MGYSFHKASFLGTKFILRQPRNVLLLSTNDTQYGCNKPVTETFELLSQSVDELLREVPTPVNTPELRRSQCVHRVPKHHQDCVVVQVPKS